MSPKFSYHNYDAFVNSRSTLLYPMFHTLKLAYKNIGQRQTLKWMRFIYHSGYMASTNLAMIFCQSELFHLQFKYSVHCLVISHYSSIIKFSGSHCWRVSLGHNSGVTIHLCFSLARYFGEASGSDHQFLESTSALRFLDSYYRVLTHKIQDCNKCSMSPLMSTKLSIIQVTSHASLARFENSKIMHFSRTVENFYKRPR